MKKNLVMILVIISIFSMLFTMAVTAHEVKTVRLVSAFVWRGQFYTRFVVTGFPEKTSFSGYYSLANNKGGMKCTSDGYRNVWCVGEISSKVHKQTASVWLNGYASYAYIP